MIPIQVKKRKSPKDGSFSFYLTNVAVTPIDEDELCKRIESRTTLSAADCKGLLDALQTELVSQLHNGRSVRLGDLGSFRCTLHSKGMDTVDKVDATTILGVRTRFAKSGSLMRYMSVNSGQMTFMLRKPKA